MTKQEEIREGIARRFHTKDRVLFKIMDEGNPSNCMWDELPECRKNFYRREADGFLSYLHFQGAVLKVDRELPRILVKASHVEDVRRIQAAILDAGYVATIPLIEIEYTMQEAQDLPANPVGFVNEH